jgi:uncharacterized membrane-anchored protein
VQFRLRRYVPPIYWLGIVLISVVGTQITDNLTDNHGVSLVTTTIGFSTALAVVFLDCGCVFRFLSGRRTDHGYTPVRGVTSCNSKRESPSCPRIA